MIRARMKLAIKILVYLTFQLAFLNFLKPADAFCPLPKLSSKAQLRAGQRVLVKSNDEEPLLCRNSLVASSLLLKRQPGRSLVLPLHYSRLISSSALSKNQHIENNRLTNQQVKKNSLSCSKQSSSQGHINEDVHTSPVLSASLLVLLDVVFRNLFRLANIHFPSSLAGCSALLAAFLVVPRQFHLFETLSPGSRLLAKWLSVFFVPSLITLPLLFASEELVLGSGLELFKVGLVVVGGFYFSLLSTAWSVVAVRKLTEKTGSGRKASEEALEKNKETDPEHGSEKTFTTTDIANVSTTKSISSVKTNKLFSDQLGRQLLAGSIASGVAAALTGNHWLGKLGLRLEPYCSAAFFLFTTLYTFVFGACLPAKITKLIHPLVTCTTLTWGAAYGLAKSTNRSWQSILVSYTRRGASTGGPLLFNWLNPGGIGAGDVLLFLLGPAVVSLACQMYERRELVRTNAFAVATSVTVSSLGGMFATAAAARFLQIGNPYLRLSLLSRNITSPLAIAISSMLGANVSLAVALVVVTGLLGANFGTALLDAHGIRDDTARGLAMGAAAHGLGTAAIVHEKLAFPFAAISMALTASACTVLVSIPIVQRALLQLTLGW